MRRNALSGPFDWLKKLIPPIPSGKSQLPILRESMLPAVPRLEEKKLTPFSFLRPKEPKALIKTPEFFGILTPAAPPPAPPKESGPAEKALWESMFTPAPEAPEEEVGEIFEILKPETIREILKPETIREAQQYSRPEQWPYGEPPLWTHTRWHLPTTMELTQFIQQKWDLPGIYEYALSQSDTNWWKRQVEESAHTGEPAVMDIDQVSRAEPPYNDMGNFLNIPDNVIEQYGAYGEQGLERFTVEVLQPMLDRVGKALDVFRPTRALRGWFELEPDQDMTFWVRYKEAKFTPQEQ